MAGVDEHRQATAVARRRNIISSLRREFDLFDDHSSVSRLNSMLSTPANMIVSADIDGLVSSMMLAAVSEWRIAALVVRSDTLWFHPAHPDLPTLLASDAPLVAVDLHAPLLPSISNHPILWGPKTFNNSALTDLMRAYDRALMERSQSVLAANPSLWAGIAAGSGTTSHIGVQYKYPFGTTQFLLALLETMNRSPRFFDRDYLPWLVANCDGGLTSIRDYHWNAEMWWSALAAMVGPASISELVYQTAVNQRPNEFADVDRRLRREDNRARSLDGKWNLKSGLAFQEVVRDVVGLVGDLSAWNDPFLDGVSDLGSWNQVVPTSGLVSLTKNLGALTPETLAYNLLHALHSVHMNFSTFQERGTALGWVMGV